MGSAEKFFDRDDRDAIEDAIRSAELETSGEIVPVLASCSGRYDRAEGIVGVLLSAVFVVVGWNLLPSTNAGVGDWSGTSLLTRGPMQIVALVVLGYVAGNLIATWVPSIRLPFTRAREIEEEVRRAAAESFQRFRVRSSAAGTGILLYISLFEHRVLVLGDDAIAAKLDPRDWEAVRDLVLDGLKSKTPREGLVAAIRRCGEVLAEHLPIAAGDRNELTNELQIVD